MAIKGLNKSILILVYLLIFGVLYNSKITGQDVAPETGRTEIIAFYSGRTGDNEIFLMNIDGSGLENLTNNLASDLCPAISPMNDRIAFLSDRDGNMEIYTMNLEGSDLLQLTNSSHEKVHPSWSPDGTKILYIIDYTSRTEIWIMKSDGTDKQRLTNNSFRDERPFMSPDGTSILFMTYRNRNFDIFLMNVDGTNQQRISDTNGHEIFPVWSPDGSKIAYSMNALNFQNPQAEIHVINSDGTNLSILTEADGRDENPCWSPDGNYIVFQSERDGNFELYYMNVDGSNQTRLTTNSAWDGWASWANLNSTFSEDIAAPGLLKNGSRLYNNFPNPFDEKTEIVFELALPLKISLIITDSNGNLMSTIINQKKYPVGKHSVVINSDYCPDGTYLCILKTGNNEILTRKLTIIK